MNLKKEDIKKKCKIQWHSSDFKECMMSDENSDFFYLNDSAIEMLEIILRNFPTKTVFECVVTNNLRSTRITKVI